MAKKTLKKCKVGPCEEETTGEYCKNCKANIDYYWGRKRPADVLKRRGRLRLFSTRLGYVMKERGIGEEDDE